MTRKITMGAARIKLGKQEKLFLGNLESRRDWGYAKEYVESMWLMLQQPNPNDYVVATGVSASVRDFCRSAFAAVDLDFEKYLETDERYLRPTEVDFLLGDPTKIEIELGWKAKTHWEELAKIMALADFKKLSKD